MAIAKDLLDTKSGSSNYSVENTDSVLQALEIMADANISAVMVTKSDKIIGIFTERDYARKVELRGLSASATPAQDVMTEKIMIVTPKTSIEDCMQLMNQYHIRHLPVVEDDAMVGMISMRDVVDILLADRESTIKGLENYIIGSELRS